MCYWLMAGGSEPLSSLTITIPDYRVTKIEKLDYVEIPEGDKLVVEEGRPAVPYFIKVIDYPKGYRVQDVKLVERTGMKTATGLKLPVVILTPAPKAPIPMKPGLYPEKDYEWKLLENPDGTTTLVIYLYPFYYDPKTSDIKFYKEYKIDVPYIRSMASITELTLEKYAYEPNETVKIKVAIDNPDKPKDLSIMMKIREYGSEKIVDSIPPGSMNKFSGKDTKTFEWRTTGFEPLDYYCEATLADATLGLLDKAIVSFSVGRSDCEITAFKADPQYFKIGDKIALSLGLKNTGFRDIAGDAVFRIHEGGVMIKELLHNFTKLAPGASLTFTDTWDSKKAKKGIIYNILGYVRYAGTATPPKFVSVSTNHRPVAKFIYLPEKTSVSKEISFDATGSEDEDGNIVEYNWDFGDGGTGSGNKVTHTYYLPGDYDVTLMVKDNDSGTGQMNQKITVGE